MNNILELENKIIYQVFVRNHTPLGTFKALEDDIERISALGIDIIYLMPIFEIGEISKKGTYGSPYSIKDYYKLSKELGSFSDLKSLIKKIHHYKMEVMLDMVFNHTSLDNVLTSSHPEYYFYKDGHRTNRVADWTDVIDLDTTKPETQDYLIDVLKYYQDIGIDHFRFDVASLIDINLFKKARRVLKPTTIFLAESVDYSFALYTKSVGFPVSFDDELYPTFDIQYNYLWYRDFENYFKYQDPFERVINKINENKILRLSCLENHDNPRLMCLVKNNKLLFKSFIEFMFTLKGVTFIYAGMEYGQDKLPNLFEKDPIDHRNDDLEIYEFFKKLIKKKHNEKPILNQHLKLEGSFIVCKTEFENKEIKENRFKI